MTDAGPGWTEERVEYLKRLWGEGLSASQIAAQIGGVTRNAVIGKVHRLGLAGRVIKPDAAGAARRPKALRAVEAEAAPEPAPRAAEPPTMVMVPPLALVRVEAPAEPDVALPVSRRVTIMELREFMCRWPMGDPTSPEFRFCGARSITGLPYCTHHAGIAYQPATERRRDRRVASIR